MPERVDFYLEEGTVLQLWTNKCNPTPHLKIFNGTTLLVVRQRNDRTIQTQDQPIKLPGFGDAN